MASVTVTTCDGCGCTKGKFEGFDWKFVLNEHGSEYLHICPICWKAMCATLRAIALTRSTAVNA